LIDVKSKIHRNAIISCPKTSNTSKDQKNTTREARRGEERRREGRRREERRGEGAAKCSYFEFK
jgi:hypothetical protein